MRNIRQYYFAALSYYPVTLLFVNDLYFFEMMKHKIRIKRKSVSRIIAAVYKYVYLKGNIGGEKKFTYR